MGEDDPEGESDHSRNDGSAFGGRGGLREDMGCLSVHVQAPCLLFKEL